MAGRKSRLQRTLLRHPRRRPMVAGKKHRSRLSRKPRLVPRQDQHLRPLRRLQPQNAKLRRMGTTQFRLQRLLQRRQGSARQRKYLLLQRSHRSHQFRNPPGRLARLRRKGRQRHHARSLRNLVPYQLLGPHQYPLACRLRRILLLQRHRHR